MRLSGAQLVEVAVLSEDPIDQKWESIVLIMEQNRRRSYRHATS
jgi:hypothetical protein